MSPPSIRTPASDQMPRRRRTARLPDNQTGLDCGTGQPRRRAILIGTPDGRITLRYSTITVIQGVRVSAGIATAYHVWRGLDKGFA